MSIVSDAQNSVGKIRYKFGADNVSGGVADCSSFTQYIYKKNGIDIGRNTEAQYSKGTSIKKQDLKAGDLVFFHSTYPSGYKDGVSHVGIYIGNGQFVHNSSNKGVTVNKLTDKYYTEHYLGARRVTTDASTTGTTAPSTIYGGTVNPTVSGDDLQTGEPSDLDIFGQLVKFICILALIILALVFLFGAFGGSAVGTVKDTIKKVKTSNE